MAFLSPLSAEGPVLRDGSDTGLATPPGVATRTAHAVRRRPPPARAGIIINAHSHRNRRAGGPRIAAQDDVLTARPASRTELSEALADFARRDVELLIIDGGDGTVRDVLTAAGTHFTAGLPRLAVLPSGKTNALAIDLGVPRGWTAEAALRAAADGRIRHRAPLEVWRMGAAQPELRGFLLGTGAFVRATRAAQRAHRMGAVQAAGVALTLAGSVALTLFGGERDGWRAGDDMRLGLDEEAAEQRARFMVMASTLERLPLGLKPFGPRRPGAKVLGVDAPPRRLPAALPLLLAGREAPWLTAAGYHRADVGTLRLSLEGDFVLDGEIYPGGDLLVRTGGPLEFVVP